MGSKGEGWNYKEERAKALEVASSKRLYQYDYDKYGGFPERNLKVSFFRLHACNVRA